MQKKNEFLQHDCRPDGTSGISDFARRNDSYCHIPDITAADAALNAADSTDVCYEAGALSAGIPYPDQQPQHSRTAGEDEEKEKERSLHRCPPPRFYQ